MTQAKVDFFPNLKESILKAHAISWAHYYPKILIKDETTSKVIDEIIRIQRIVLLKVIHYCFSFPTTLHNITSIELSQQFMTTYGYILSVA